MYSQTRYQTTRSSNNTTIFISLFSRHDPILLGNLLYSILLTNTHRIDSNIIVYTILNWCVEMGAKTNYACAQIKSNQIEFKVRSIGCQFLEFQIIHFYNEILSNVHVNECVSNQHVCPLFEQCDCF